MQEDLRNIHSYIGLHPETRDISNKQSDLTPKIYRKRRAKKAQSEQKKAMKIKAEINEIEYSKIQKINKSKGCFSKR